MSADKFCLRWNDFESNVSSAFRDLREEKDFFDVTLACEDSQMEAHKVILSACSPFFKNILRRNPHQHPLLYLKGVKSIELSNVLSFMYQGEVNVAQDSLNTFLTVAEELQVKGLTQEGGQQSSVKHKSESDHSSSKHQQKLRPNFPSAPTSFQNPSHDRDIQEVVHIKPEATGTHQAVVEPHQGVSDGYEEAGVVAHYDQGEFQYENYGESEDGALVDASVYDTSIDKGKQIKSFWQQQNQYSHFFFQEMFCI